MDGWMDAEREKWRDEEIEKWRDGEREMEQERERKREIIERETTDPGNISFCLFK